MLDYPTILYADDRPLIIQCHKHDYNDFLRDGTQVLREMLVLAAYVNHSHFRMSTHARLML